MDRTMILLLYRGTSLIRNRHPPRTTVGHWAWSYCRVLGEVVSHVRGTPGGPHTYDDLLCAKKTLLNATWPLLSKGVSSFSFFHLEQHLPIF